MKMDESNIEKKFSDLFMQAFIVTIGNPKAIIFFTALFPQFISTQKLTSLLNRTVIKRLFNRIVGGIFIGMGIGLATGKVE